MSTTSKPKTTPGELLEQLRDKDEQAFRLILSLIHEFLRK